MRIYLFDDLLTRKVAKSLQSFETVEVGKARVCPNHGREVEVNFPSANLNSVYRVIRDGVSSRQRGLPFWAEEIRGSEE